MDRLSRSERSALMSRIRGDALGPETRLRAELRRIGIRHTANDRRLPGSPDIAIKQHRLAVFVHGCFWHACRRHYRAPTSNVAFWRCKAETNRLRDSDVRRQLNRLGWRTMVVWEHESVSHAVRRITQALYARDVRRKPEMARGAEM